jgi:N-acetylglucosaminyldiphosphoundecaprenol N-acetyl-beta-D-mannosaminyltransferase
MRKSYFNIPLDITDREEALKTCSDVLGGKVCKSLFFVNAHCFNIAQENLLYKNALKNSDLIYNDGIGIKIGSYFAGVKLKNNLNGTDFIPEIIQLCAKQNKKIYLLGTKEDIVLKAKLALEQEYNNIMIVGTHDGFFSEADEKKIVNDINECKPDILIVGMGVPRQELWISKIKNDLNTVRLCIAGGAIIDFLAGAIKRAPKWMRKNNIEWIYRLYLEPKRMWKRYLIGNFRFICFVILHLLKVKK